MTEASDRATSPHLAETAPSKRPGGLGIALDSWQKAVQNRVETDHLKHLDRLRANNLFVVDEENPDASAKLTQNFNRHIEEVLRAHDGPVLHLRFTDPNNPNELLGSGDLAEDRDEIYRGPLLQACDEANYQGYIGVNYYNLNPETAVIPPDPSGQRIGTDITAVLIELHKRNPGKSVVVIIDGLAENSANVWGVSKNVVHPALSMDKHEYPTTVIVKTLQQWVDRLPEWESSWMNNFDYDNIHLVSRAAKEDALRDREWNQEQFAQFADALAKVVGRTEQGEKVCMQAPNNWGKTTMLGALARLPKGAEGRPSDIEIAEAAPNGSGIESMSDFQMLTLDSLKQRGIKTIIVDEAGRIDDPSHIALREQVSAFEKAGITVVRIYPGNVPTPEGYKVVDPSITA